jgi:hypothetical protein
MPRPLTLARLFVLALGGACTAPDKFLSIPAPAVVDSLVLVVNDPQSSLTTPVYGLSVLVCGTERAMWTIAADGSRLLPSRITYGRTVAGFTTQAGPFPLKPGCYDVFASGTRSVRFDVDSAGTVRARKPR